MVSLRCKMVVRSELDKLGLTYHIAEFGEVVLSGTLSQINHERLNQSLYPFGMSLMDYKEAVLYEKIKNVIIEMIHYADELPHEKISEYLPAKLNVDYISLSDLFAHTKGTTIEQYVLFQKMEKVKELLIYDSLTLSEIAHKLHFKNAEQLSSQLKKVTGLKPSFFKGLKTIR